MEHPVLINIYNNIYEFIKKNKLQPLEDKIIDNNKFYEIINSNKYIKIIALSNDYTDTEKNMIKENIQIFSLYKNKDSYTINDIKKKHNITDTIQKITVILLLHDESDYDSKTANFKALINTIRYPNSNVITISKDSLSTHVNKQIVELSNETKKIFSYTYDKFKFIVNNHVLCSPHSILNKDEEYNLLNNILKKKKSNLPKIKISDPQIIWIGGEIGNIVKIERDSEVTGKSLYYRVIIND